MNTPTAVVCSHCGLPVPAALVDPAGTEQFCCAGCRTVYQVIHGCGLERFYRVRENLAADARPALTTDRKYADFDDAAFGDLYYQPLDDGTLSVELYLEGVHCAACVWLVEKLPQVLAGVIESRLNLRRGLVQVRWDPARVRLSQIGRTLDSLGYPPHPAKDVRARQLRAAEDHRFLIRLGVAGACMGNVMTLAFALYGGEFTGIEAPYANLFRWASMIFGLVALAWPGNIFFRGAWAAVRTRTAHLDVPIALGLAAGGIAGTVNALRGTGAVYFDSLTMLVLLLLVGRWLQRRQQAWANDSLEMLFSLTPATARRVEGAQIVDVPIEAVRPGDVVDVRAGDCVPADGVILAGHSTIDQALLTGESAAVAAGPGDPVHAGTLNRGAALRVQVAAVGTQTRVGRLMQLVEEQSRARAPIVQFADRLAHYFVLAVIVLATATFALWSYWNPGQAVNYAVAMLIVTCPCALGLATPLAVTVTVGRAARRQILIKGGESLELLAGQGTILVDKTGTLTLGRSTLVSWTGDETARPLVAALERHSAHPIAVTLAAALAGSSGDAPRTSGVVQTLGGGLEGCVDGRGVRVGSAAFVRGPADGIDAALLAAEQAALDQALTPIWVAVNGRCVAVAAVGDPLRGDVPAALDALRRLGWQPRILSGDHPAVVAAIARQLGIQPADARGGVSPEEKARYVRELMTGGAVLMVGDGVNDAAALSAATVGIAVHGGAEASLAAAQVYLARPGLMPIVELIRAARATLRVIYRCLAASLVYNCVAAALTIAGLISPLIAAILMPISSFTVLTLAYAARTFGGRR